MSLAIVYIPSSASQYFLNAAIFESFKKYIEKFIHTFKGQSRLRTSEFKTNRQPYLNSEAWLVIDEFFKFASDWLSLLLNIIFNVITLGFVINPAVIVAYASSLPLIFLCIFGSKNRIRTSSKIAQSNRTEMMQTLLLGAHS